jgi:hypothetical protein
MTVRVWKNVLRSKMRSVASAHRGVTGAVLRQLTIDMLVTELNYIVGGHTLLAKESIQTELLRDAFSGVNHRLAGMLASSAIENLLPDGTAWNGRVHITLFLSS